MKKFVVLGIIFLLVIGLSLGCAPERRVDPQNDNRGVNDPQQQDNMLPNDQNNLNAPNNQNMQNDSVPRDNWGPGGGPDGMNNTGTTNDQAQNRRIAGIATDVDGVNNATVVTTGDTAYVGIDMDKDMEREETERLKERVGDAIKDDNEGISQVYVSADVDSVERLREIGRDVQGGRPITGFLDELTEMFRRPAPRVQ